MRYSWQRKIWKLVVVLWTIVILMCVWDSSSSGPNPSIVMVLVAAIGTFFLAYMWSTEQQIRRLLARRRLEQPVVDTSLAIAEKIQRQLLPKNIPNINGLDFHAYSQPCEQIGGDFYQILTQADRTIIAIGDVAGHGLPSGIISIMVDTLLYTFSMQAYTPVAMLRELNRVIYRRIDPSLFATLLLLTWYPYEQKLTLTSAGFGPILHAQQQSQQVVSVKSNGIAIGMISDITPYIEEQVLPFAEGDSLVVSTDGIIEMRSRSKHQLGIAGLQSITAQHAFSSPTAQHLFNAVSKEITHHRPMTEKQADDWTLMVIKRSVC
jgi:sigma-B regulation protein RsbU (phosphoserine phosphatase)